MGLGTVRPHSLLGAGTANAPTVRPARRIFYGWYIVAASIACLIVSSGIGFYSPGVLLDPLLTQNGWSKSTVSLAFSMYLALPAIFGLVLGRWVDRYGPRWLMVVGALVFAVGLAAMGQVRELWQLYLDYLLLAIGWSGISLLTISTLLANWFVRRRGFATSLTLVGLSLGGVIMVPVSTILVTSFGLSTACLALAGFSVVVVVPLALVVLRRRPSDLGLYPDGDREPPRSGAAASGRRRVDYRAQTRAWSVRAALATGAFWAIVAAFLTGMLGQNAFLLHQISFLKGVLGPGPAAIAVSVTAAASIPGRLILGWLADRVDKRWVAVFCFGCEALAMLLITRTDNHPLIYLCVALFGFSMAGVVMMQALLVGEVFGMVSFGLVYGVVGALVMGVASIGPALGGFLYDATQSYSLAFTLFGICSIVACLAVMRVRVPRAPTPEPSRPLPELVQAES